MAAEGCRSETWSLSLPRGRTLELGSDPVLMGVLNVTPDSFSDGGLWLEPEAAVAHGLELLAAGAAIVDLGAESTRPGGGVYGEGAAEVPASAEIERLLPVLRALRRRTEAVLSVDTRKAEVARVAIGEGADLINDVGGLADAGMREVLATSGVPVVLMHARGSLRNMQRDIRFRDVVTEVRSEIVAALELAAASGVAADRIIVDPGIGFGKTYEQNLELLRRLGELGSLGRPVLIGASRKSFIGLATGAEARDRDPGSLAAAGFAWQRGAAILRVHDVAATRQYLGMLQALAGEGVAVA